MALDSLMNDFPMTLPPGGPPLALSRKEKAAIVVRLLLGQGAVPALSSLTEEKQTELAVQLARMQSVDQATVISVAEEFAAEIERIGLSFPKGLSGALGLLDGTLSENATRELRKMAPDGDTESYWKVVNEADTERLLPFLETESVEVAAVILSKLGVNKAAEVLSKLSGERARKITLAVSRTGGVAPDVVARIGRSMAEQLEVRPTLAFDGEPVSRVGAILNYTSASVRDTLLEGLDQDDKEFADQVRASIFTFANIAERISARDVPRIQRDIAQEDLALVASKAEGDDAKSVDFILANISKRMAENIRDDAKEIENVKTDDYEAAMLRIVSKIRELEEAGEIFFVLSDD